MIEKITIIVLSIALLSSLIKDRVIHLYRRVIDNKRETERQRIKQIVEEVLQDIIKE